MQFDVSALVNALEPYFGAGGAWKLLSEQILGVAAANITFSSISGVYRSLVLVIQVRSAYAGESDTVILRFNADSGANYDTIEWHAGGHAANVIQYVNRARAFSVGGACEGATATANVYSAMQVWFPGYALTDRYKKSFAQGAEVYGDASSDIDLVRQLGGSRWRNTAAITSIALSSYQAANFVAGSRAALYGIL